MRIHVVMIAVIVVCTGCTKPATPVDVGAKKDKVRSSPQYIRGPAPGTSSSVAVIPDGIHSYPEKSEVVAILHRARELQQKFQFEDALELVVDALEIDPYSPAAQAMHRQLLEILKKVGRKAER